MRIIKCKECNKEKPHYAKGLCAQCYRRQFYRKNDKPMSENKECTQYLGCHITNKIINKLFDNIELCEYGNPDYDFITHDGYKIDAKSSCKHRQGNWTFLIKRNKIADYFLCLAFDNKDNLNPEHIWLIPSYIMNDKQLISISESTLSKWDEYIYE